MKKGLVILAVLLVGLIVLSAPYYYWPGNGFHEVGFGNTLTFEGDVDVQVHQWIAGKWVTRTQLYTDRGMTIGSSGVMPSGIDIGKYGNYNNVFLGGIGLISNYDVDVEVKKDDDPGPNNFNNLITALKLWSYNKSKTNGWLSFNAVTHPDLIIPGTEFPLAGEGTSKVTMLLGQWAVPGNLYGPELAVFSNLSVPWTKAPGQGKFYLDIIIEPTVSYTLF
jgi:hypothetical protein